MDDYRSQLSGQVGGLCGRDYTNVFMAYALITSVHYNYFLTNTSLSFKPIRQVSYNELAQIGFNASFIDSYNEYISNHNLTPVTAVNPTSIKPSGFFDGLLNFFAATYQVVAQVVGSISEGISQAANGPCSVSGNIYYYDLNTNAIRNLPNVIVKFWNTGRTFTTANDNAGYSITLSKNREYEIEIEFKSTYGWLSENDIVPYYYIAGKRQFGGDSTRFDIVISNNNSFYMGTAAECYYLYKNDTGVALPQLRLLYSTGVDLRGSNIAGYSMPWTPMNILWGDAHIIMFRDYVRNRAYIAHEYGHYIFWKRTGWAYGGFLSGMINYPDGTTDQVYGMDRVWLLNEGFAELFAGYFGKHYGYSDGSYAHFERNFGSRELVFRSTISNSNSIGSFYNKDWILTYYLYEFPFYRFWLESSILYDLLDDNSLPAQKGEFGSSTGSLGKTLSDLSYTNFWDQQYNNTFFFTNFTSNQLHSREMKLDRISISFNTMMKVIDTLFSSYFNDMTYNGGSLELLTNLYTTIGCSYRDIDDLLSLHRSNTPAFADVFHPVFSGSEWNSLLGLICTPLNDTVRLDWNPFNCDGFEVYKWQWFGFYQVSSRLQRLPAYKYDWKLMTNLTGNAWTDGQFIINGIEKYAIKVKINGQTSDYSYPVFGYASNLSCNPDYHIGSDHVSFTFNMAELTEVKIYRYTDVGYEYKGTSTYRYFTDYNLISNTAYQYMFVPTREGFDCPIKEFLTVKTSVN